MSFERWKRRHTRYSFAYQTVRAYVRGTRKRIEELPMGSSSSVRAVFLLVHHNRSFGRVMKANKYCEWVGGWPELACALKRDDEEKALLVVPE